MRVGMVRMVSDRSLFFCQNGLDGIGSVICVLVIEAVWGVCVLAHVCVVLVCLCQASASSLVLVDDRIPNSVYHYPLVGFRYERVVELVGIVVEAVA